MVSVSEFEKAKNYAFRLFKFRLRSEEELRQRLKNREFAPLIIEELINYFKKNNFLNDEEFALCWASSRIKKPFGVKRIAYELKQKGINSKIINKTIENIKSRHNEYALAKQLINTKIKKIKQNQDPFKTKARLYNFLLRRGFSSDVAAEIIQEL